MYKNTLKQQSDDESNGDDMTMDERLHRWIDQELAAELERTVVVSNLPANEDDLLNKLEEYLSKSANCTGNIERIEYLDDTSVIIVFLESKASENLILYTTDNFLYFHGARLKIETLYEYEHNHDEGKNVKGSIFGQTTVSVTDEWLPDIHQYFGKINEMAANLGLCSTKSDTGYSFTGNFDTLVRLRNKIEWLIFDIHGVVVNPDERMDTEPVHVSLPSVPLDHTPHGLTSQDDMLIQSEHRETTNCNPMESNDVNASVNGIGHLNIMDCEDKSDDLTRVLKFKPELVKYTMRVHSTKIEEISQSCYVNIQTVDESHVEISLSDSIPGTETDVENAVEQLKLLFKEIDQEISVQYFDISRFDVSDDFRKMIETQLMDDATIVVIRQLGSSTLCVHGKNDVIKNSLVKVEDLLMKEVERVAALKRELERKMEAERKERESREAELREAREREARRMAEALEREEEERRAHLAELEESERRRVNQEKIESVSVRVENQGSHDQPLPPPSTGDDWLEPSVNEYQVHVNGDNSDDVTLNSNGTELSTAEQQNTPSKNNVKNGRDILNGHNDRTSPKQKSDISPTSTLRPLNPRFHEFLSRNFFQSTGGSGAYMYDIIFNGVHITVKRGDIAKEPAAVIVSSNDVELSCGGALSSTIDKTSGSIIHAKCLEWMDAYGTPVEGQIVEIDSEGVLPCNKVFFVVMPNWNAEEDQVYLESQLRQSCKNILQKARDTRNVSSVAIPGLGTGKFYFPCDVYARIMTDALKEFLQAKGRMLEIRFVDLDFRVLQALQREFQNRLKHPEKANEYEQSLAEIYRQTTDNGEPLPTGFIERTPPTGFERVFRRQTSAESHERERKWVRKFRSLSDTAGETRFESCVLCTRRVTVGFFGYIPCRHIVCHLCSKGMELHEKRACPTCFKSFSKLQISKF